MTLWKRVVIVGGILKGSYHLGLYQIQVISPFNFIKNIIPYDAIIGKLHFSMIKAVTEWKGRIFS